MTTSAKSQTTSPTSTPTKQPDRLLKMECPSCGAVARMSPLAIRLSGGIECTRDKLVMAVTPKRRSYRQAATI